MKIETLLPLNRESRDQDHQPLIQGPSYTVSSRFGGGQSDEVAQWWWMTGVKPLRRSGYNRCLSIDISIANEARQIAVNPVSVSGSTQSNPGSTSVQRRLCPRTCSRHRCASWTTRVSTGLCPCPAALHRRTGVRPGAYPRGGNCVLPRRIYPFANLCQKSSEVSRRLCKRFNAAFHLLIPRSTQTHLRESCRGLSELFCINRCYIVGHRR